MEQVCLFLISWTERQSRKSILFLYFFILIICRSISFNVDNTTHQKILSSEVFPLLHRYAFWLNLKRSLAVLNSDLQNVKYPFIIFNYLFSMIFGTENGARLKLVAKSIMPPEDKANHATVFFIGEHHGGANYSVSLNE